MITGHIKFQKKKELHSFFGKYILRMSNWPHLSAFLWLGERAQEKPSMLFLSDIYDKRNAIGVIY